MGFDRIVRHCPWHMQEIEIQSNTIDVSYICIGGTLSHLLDSNHSRWDREISGIVFSLICHTRYLRTRSRSFTL